MEPVRYQYRFSFADGREEAFGIELDGDTLAPTASTPAKLPEWTRLGHKQCPHCTLDPLEVFHCPLAVQLAPVVDTMSNVLSIDNVKVEVMLNERTVTREASAQEGLSSLMGIITATCGCPHTAFFRPMARFHLPFASSEETFYRAASMYMLGQYYRWQAGKSVDMEMEGIHRFYKEVAEVNKGIAGRLRSERREDGSINAIVLLDMLVQSMPMLLEETLEGLKPLFSSYIDHE